MKRIVSYTLMNLRMVLAAHLNQIRTNINATICHTQQLASNYWLDETSDPVNTPATANQVYELLSSIGAIQEMIPQLSLQLRRSLEVVSGNDFI